MTNNSDIITDFIHCWGRKDIDGIMAHFSEDAIYINTEGRLQYAYQASFPPSEAKTDWKIINQISEMLNLNWGFVSLDDVRKKIKNQYPDLFNQVSADRPYKRLLANKASKISFDNKEIGSMIKDFYLTDSISRLSKTWPNVVKSVKS